MFFLNLTAGEFVALLGVLGAAVTALYLLDTTRRKRVVSTLRFWTPARSAEQQQSRRRMRDPWSLLLQLAGLLLLLLAAAELEWGTRERLGRDHVVLLDTSAWSADTGGAGRAAVLGREKALARQYFAAIPGIDRVLLVRADGLTTPVTAFTADRAELAKALRESVSAFSALNLEQALSFATQAQSWSGGRKGEIVYVGPGMMAEDSSVIKPANLRVLSVAADRGNVGIRSLLVRRGERDANSWQATVTVQNYSPDGRAVQLETAFAGTRFAPRTLQLARGEEAAAVYDFETHTAGELVAQLATPDSLASDNRATLQLPRSGALHIAVFSDRPDTLRPLFAANWRLNVQYFRPADYYPAGLRADFVVIDRFAPSTMPRVASLWIQPVKGSSPLPVKARAQHAEITHWHTETALGAGLRAKETRLPKAEVFETFDGDTAVASIAEGPVVVARPASNTHPKIAVVGFDPLSPELKFEVTTPLLFANLLHWLSPESFRTFELSAATVGAASVALDPSENSSRLRVTDEKGFAVPFTVRARALQFFASHPSTVQVLSDDGERFLSLTLPDVAQRQWTPPAEAPRGLPPFSSFLPAAVDLWKWLAVAAAMCLLAEWILFGRQRTLVFRKQAAVGRGMAKAS